MHQRRDTSGRGSTRTTARPCGEFRLGWGDNQL